ncbi:MAG: hypothetical protein EAZ12_06355 [Sphingobacteriia bacterium]|nr:MAG: hypothetical protein EAZ12_06355 [Sphingobacteriia bacterium]
MITDEQYESLFGFCRRHYVQFYDVQVELVDHLSAAIEERMSNNPKLSFEQALEAVYAGFGIKGFSDIVATREKMVYKQCRKRKWRLFFSYFTVPKVAMTICIYAAILLIGKMFVQDYHRIVLLSFIGLSLIILEINHSLKTSKLFEQQTKTLLYTGERLNGLISSSVFIQVILSRKFAKVFELNEFNYLDYTIVSFILVLMFVSILAHRDFIKELYNSALQKYPLAFGK